MPPQPRSPSESVSESSLSSGLAPRPRPFAPPAMRSVKSHSFHSVAGSSASKSSSTSPLSAASSSGCASRMILMMSAPGGGRTALYFHCFWVKVPNKCHHTDRTVSRLPIKDQPLYQPYHSLLI